MLPLFTWHCDNCAHDNQRSWDYYPERAEAVGEDYVYYGDNCDICHRDVGDVRVLMPGRALLEALGLPEAPHALVLGFKRCSCAHPVWLLSWYDPDSRMKYIHYFCEPDPSLQKHEYPVPGLRDCGDDQQRALICCIKAVKAQRQAEPEGDRSGAAQASEPRRPHASLPVNDGSDAPGYSPDEPTTGAPAAGQATAASTTPPVDVVAARGAPTEEDP